MGGIVAGAVVGSIAVVAIFVFGWYKIRTHRQNNVTQDIQQQRMEQYPPTSPVRDTVDTYYDKGFAQTGAVDPRDSVVQPESGFSGNLQYGV